MKHIVVVMFLFKSLSWSFFCYFVQLFTDEWFIVC